MSDFPPPNHTLAGPFSHVSSLQIHLLCVHHHLMTTLILIIIMSPEASSVKFFQEYSLFVFLFLFCFVGAIGCKGLSLHYVSGHGIRELKSFEK